MRLEPREVVLWPLGEVKGFRVYRVYRFLGSGSRV